MKESIWSNLYEFNSESERCSLKTAKLLELGGVRYPKFGNILILAGGPGSGKGHQLKNLIGLDGKVLDVDKLKEFALNHFGIKQEIKRKHDFDIDNCDLRNPEHTTKLHEILKELNLKQRSYDSLNYIKDLRERKPNLIFDVTLSDWEQFESICDLAKTLQYDMKNIHIVWVLNTLDVSLEQNSKRSRVVPEEIVRAIFRSVSGNLKRICNMGEKLKKYMDGDIWVSFNKIHVDTEGIVGNSGNGFFYTKANMFKIKSSGGSVKFPLVEGKELTQKIYEYTQDSNWLKQNLD